MHLFTVLYSKLMGLMSRVLMKFITLPAPLVFTGPGSSAALCKAIAGFGHKRVLVVTDKMLVELGIVAQATRELEEQGIGVEIYDAILPDPDFAQVDGGIQHCRTHSCDAVLAIGGGSSLDAAKIIALSAGSDQSPRDVLGFFKVSRRGLPTYGLPTTAGTGSEATMVSVITDTATSTKCFIVDPKLVPSAVALDASLMTGLPPAITAATGMDALTHAIESALSREANDETRQKALTAVSMIFNNLEAAVKDGANLQTREAMAIASYYAGSAFTITNVGYVHGLAHQLGALCHLPHGLANALFLPHILDFYLDKAAPEMARIAQAAAVGQNTDSDQERARKLVTAVRELKASIGMPSHADGLRKEMVSELVDRALKESHGLYGYPVPKYMRRKECEDIVSKLLPA